MMCIKTLAVTTGFNTVAGISFSVFQMSELWDISPLKYINLLQPSGNFTYHQV
jgi:hypothetical protein